MENTMFHVHASLMHSADSDSDFKCGDHSNQNSPYHEDWLKAIFIQSQKQTNEALLRERLNVPLKNPTEAQRYDTWKDHQEMNAIIKGETK